MKHITHVITSLSRGGAQSMLVKLALHPTFKEGVQQHIISLNEDFDYPELFNQGIKITLIKAKNPIKILIELRSALNQNSTDIIQSWMYHANFFVFLARFKKHKIFFNIRHSLHDIKMEKTTTRFIIFVGKFFSRFVNKVVYCSKVSLSQHINYGYPSYNSIFIPNGFEIEKFKYSISNRKIFRESLDFMKDDFVIASIARYHPMKNHEGIIKGFSKFVKFAPKSKLVLIGKGLDKENHTLRSLCNLLNVSDKVFMLGMRNDIPSILSGIDVFISASNWGEAFPNVIGEAMAIGKICVTNDVGDSKYILGKNGYVIEDSIEDTLIKVFKLTREEKAKIEKNLRERARKEFSIKKVAKLYLNLYEKSIDK